MNAHRKLASRLPTSLVILLAASLVSGCQGIVTNVPPEVKVYAEKVPEVENSSKSPCWQQRQIAKQQAFLRSTISGKVVVRKISPACGGQSIKQQATS